MSRQRRITRQDELIRHLLFGDIDEAPLSAVSEELAESAASRQWDEEQRTRIAAAATVRLFFEGRLHENGGAMPEQRRRKKSP